jgi:hypothetical protein
MPSNANDNFERYFAEKIWEMIPAIYRHEDGIAEEPGVLRALVEILAEQAAILRRSHDRLWEDQFIEFCNDWAVPYIADLVGTRLVSALNKRGRRVDVAKTIYYRRRKGTLRVLEELISDITGWEGKVVENFRRLGRTRHGLDPEPLQLTGRFSGTMPGGWADLRQQRASELTGGPFDEFHHTADMRQHSGVNGRYGIPKLAFHLYRLAAFKVESATPYEINDWSFTFDPSGRDIPLFMPRNRPDDWDEWRSALEWELPAQIRCRVLNYAKSALVPDAISVEAPEGEIAPAQIVAGDLSDWSANPPGKRLVIDPGRGRLLFLGDAPDGDVKVTYHYGFSGEIGAGTYDRREVEDLTPDQIHEGGGEIPAGGIENEGVTQINDSATYGPVGSKNKVKDLTLQAANYQRPYLRLESNWTFNTLETEDSELTLDGLWIGAAGNYEIILRGDYERVTIRHCTFDPGGIDADGNNIPPVPLVIEGQVEEMIIDASITGSIMTRDEGVIERLIVRDSILDSSATPALSLDSGVVEMERVTVFGELVVHRLWASEALITGVAEVTDTQNGCFRFSAAPEGSRLPKPYEPHIIKDSKHYFTSRQFGQPGYGQLSQTAPEEIRRGAENGSEIGAFSALINPIKLDSLRAKVEEYMPFGLIPIFILET